MDDDSSSDLSSDLSSIASLSPPPPMNYPSPPSSQDIDSTSTGCKRKPGSHADESSPRKRKKAEPKPRTTRYLNLHGPGIGVRVEQKPELDLLLKLLRKRRKIVVIAGAGISVSAGIPDFRSSKGLFTTLKSEHKIKGSGKHLFDASVYQTDSSTSTFHDMVRSLSRLVNTAKPTVFHEMIATLAAEGRLMRLYTQNVDGIDVSLPSLETNVPLNMKGPWPRSIQLHGGLEKMVCSKCNNLSNFEAALFDGPEPPPCPVCIETDKVRTDHAGKRSHGIGRLRPRIVLYNEHNPDEEAIGAVVGSDLRARPDAVIVVGTSMKIPGVRRIVREMCGVVRGRRDGLTVWVNHEPPPVGKEFEECWDLVVKGASDDVARQYSIDGKENVECTESEVERAKYRIGEVQVMIDLNAKEPGIPTPAASPRVGPTKMLKVALKSKASTSKKPQVQKQRSAKKCATKSASIKPSLTSKSKKKSFTTKISKPSNLKIDKSFRATKPNLQIVKEVKDENHDPDTIQTIEVPTTEFPISCSLQATLNEPSPLRTSHQRRSSDIVSPTGSIPKDMYRLLCESP